MWILAIIGSIVFWIAILLAASWATSNGAHKAPPHSKPCDDRQSRNELYRQLASNKDALSSAYEHLKDRHEQLKTTKAQLNNWYNKSESIIPLYGNQGKKISTFSIFGQSTMQRDSLKQKRDQLSDQIGSIKTKITTLKNQRAQLKTQLSNLSN